MAAQNDLSAKISHLSLLFFSTKHAHPLKNCIEESKLLYPEHPQLFVYERSFEEKTYTVVCNLSREACRIPAELHGKAILKNTEFTDTLPPYGAFVTAAE